MKLTVQQIHEAYCMATPDAWNKSWPEVREAVKQRYEIIAKHLNEHATREIQERIERHIASLESAIEEQRARIRETYDSGMHTNVDPQRAAIFKYEQRKRALEVILDEIIDGEQRDEHAREVDPALQREVQA